MNLVKQISDTIYLRSREIRQKYHINLGRLFYWKKMGYVRYQKVGKNYLYCEKDVRYMLLR